MQHILTYFACLSYFFILVTFNLMVFEKKLSSYSQQSNAFSSYCIVVSWLVLGEKSSLGFLILSHCLKNIGQD